MLQTGLQKALECASRTQEGVGSRKYLALPSNSFEQHNSQKVSMCFSWDGLLVYRRASFLCSTNKRLELCTKDLVFNECLFYSLQNELTIEYLNLQITLK